MNESQGQDLFTPGTRANDFIQEYFNGNISSNFDDLVNIGVDGTTNTGLPNDYVYAQKQDLDFWRDSLSSILLNRGNSVPQAPTFINPFGQLASKYNTAGSELPVLFTGTTGTNVTSPFSAPYFYTTAANGDVINNLVVFKAATNADKCIATVLRNGANGNTYGGPAYNYKDANGNIVMVDGAYGGVDPITGKALQGGVVEGTPTAIINNNQINQIVDGASLQLNWNFEQHKFMVGASIDAATADYRNTSQLGFLDNRRNAYLDPMQANPQFLGAMEPISNNNFEGTNTTKSIYFSETWMPTEKWSFNVSGRYNATKTKNKIAARYGTGVFGLGDLVGVPDNYSVCDGDCSTNRPEVNYKKPRIFNALDPAETEKFSYYSFNPSLGATWQANENLNLFANVAQGTRTPSVIELGCALDKTPVGPVYTAADGTKYQLPKSVVENRQCTLPTTLSGDPFLPQIKATTYDIGARGAFNNLLGTDSLQWNLGIYQTSLKNDIYFVTVQGGGGFFDSIGDTRRRGIEAGLSGKKDKWQLRLNYALTDATFENNFLMLSENNSSSKSLDGYGNVIEVKKGSRMPGVSLHNLNASVGYELTPSWQVGLSAILHSESYVRGNENNEHKVGVIQTRGLGAAGNALRQPTDNPGTVPGYAVFNFQMSYQFNKEWTGTMLINNIFDREYFTAGRLGRNPFSPKIDGNIGPDGYNHNSNDWLSTNFIAPGAPRGIWFSLNWRFVPD